MAVGILEVQLLSAKGLGNSDFWGMDPYVLIEYKNQKHKSSVARGRSGNPSWNETFKFTTEYPGNGRPYKLKLKIMDEDKISKDDFIGETTIFVEDFLALGAENGTAKWQPTKYRVVQADQSYRGEIQVALSFNLKEESKLDKEEYVDGNKVNMSSQS